MTNIKTVSEERFEYLKTNNPPCISGCFITKDKKVDIKDFQLSYKGELKRIEHLTKKGYYSKKPLFVFGINRVELLPNGRKIILLTDTEAKYINDNFCDLDGKIFKTEHQLQMEHAKEEHKRNKREGTVKWITF